MDLPNSSHFIYIPIVLMIGIVLGFIWGGKATREALLMQEKLAEKRDLERARKKAAREAALQEETADKKQPG